MQVTHQVCSQAQPSATIDNWGPHYIKKVGQVIDGNWQVEDYFGHMNEDAVQMAPFNMSADVKAKAQSIKDAIENGEYFAFTGPIKDNTGKLQLADGVVADDSYT